MKAILEGGGCIDVGGALVELDEVDRICSGRLCEDVLGSSVDCVENAEG